MENGTQATEQDDQNGTNAQGQQGAQLEHQEAQADTNSQQSQGTSQAPTQPDPQAQGQTVNRYKYERETAAKDAKIAELEKALEGYKGVSQDLETLKQQLANKNTEDALKKAGCHDVVAASARLGEFDGNIEKLKEAAPYLFTSADTSKSTGGSKKGTPDKSEELDEKLDKAFGLK